MPRFGYGDHDQTATCNSCGRAVHVPELVTIGSFELCENCAPHYEDDGGQPEWMTQYDIAMGRDND